MVTGHTNMDAEKHLDLIANAPSSAPYWDFFDELVKTELPLAMDLFPIEHPKYTLRGCTSQTSGLTFVFYCNVKGEIMFPICTLDYIHHIERELTSRHHSKRHHSPTDQEDTYFTTVLHKTLNRMDSGETLHIQTE